MVADDGAVLHDAVVVDDDRGRADVGSFADFDVTDVGQVGHLRAGAHDGVLGLDVGTELGLGRKARARADEGERTDQGTRPELSAAGLGAHDAGALVDDDVGQ